MDIEILLRFLWAALWGGIVGAEREYHTKSAGFRTMIMISIGSCFFTMMSKYIGGDTNPDRIASNIVTGIGFLGAGVIFRGQNKVNGMTTAATIWAVAAVGMGIGGGHYFTAACASILIVLVLAILPYSERIIDELNKSVEYTIKCKYSEQVQNQYEKILQEHKLKHKPILYIKEDDHLTISWNVQGREKNHKAFVNTMSKDESLMRFEF